MILVAARRSRPLDRLVASTSAANAFDAALRATGMFIAEASIGELQITRIEYEDSYSALLSIVSDPGTPTTQVSTPNP